MELKPVDRLPFWPKIDGSYIKKWGNTLPYYHAYFGSDRIEGIGGACREERTTCWHDIKINGSEFVTAFGTPHGVLYQKNYFDAASQALHPVEYPIKTKRDVELMMLWYQDAAVRFDEEQREWSAEQYEDEGEDAYIIENVGESPLMYFLEWLAGIEQGQYLLADYPGEVEGLFAAMHKNLLDKFRIAAEKSCADSLFLTENTSTTVISPAQYEKYCYKHIGEYAKIVNERGKPMTLHMCGHLKALLPLLSRLPVTAFEAFTPPTVGNTSLLDGRSACPDKCLIGGTNAVNWLQPADAIIEYIDRTLDSLPHHRGLLLSSSGVMPPACEPETIKTVGMWLRERALKL